MQCFEIRLKQNDGGLKTVPAILKAVATLLNNPMEYHSIDISPKVSLAPDSKLQTELKKTYDLSIRQGYQNGCYGARDGSGGNGLTLWVDASHVADRCLVKNEDGTESEYANIHHLILENGGKLIKNSEGEVFDGDDLEQVFEDAGMELKRDNSYNWSGQGNEVEFIFDFDFSLLETDKKAILFVKYHCGGDPRGNYTSRVAYSFDSIDDLHSALIPCNLLKETA